jgi:hypothetical protein
MSGSCGSLSLWSTNMSYKQLLKEFDKRAPHKSKRGGYRVKDLADELVTFKSPPDDQPEQLKEFVYNLGSDFMHKENERVILASALTNLWANAVSELTIRHPDPRVIVRNTMGRTMHHAYLNFTPAAFGAIVMTNTRDTRDQDRVLPSFEIPWAAKSWPGEGPAKAFIAAVWGVLLVHDALELVTDNTKVPTNGHDPFWYYEEYALNRVLDPHDSSRGRHIAVPGRHQETITKCASGDIEGVLNTVMTSYQTTKLLTDAQPRADIELANEIEWLKDPTYHG